MVLVEWDQQQLRLFDAKICSSFFQYCDQYSTCTNVNTFFFSSTQIRIWACYPCLKKKVQAQVVQKLDSAIHRINHYPADTYYGKQLRYPLDSAVQRLNNQGQNVYSGTWTLVPCMHTVYISVLRQSPAKFMFQNGVRQCEME